MDQLASHHLLAIDLLIEPPFVIGATRVDPPAHEIMIGGKARRLQALQMKVLVALAAQQGHIVSRDELVQRCWDGRIVGEDVINRAISQIRKAAVDGGFAIETVPKAGYRLVEARQDTKPQSKRWLVAAAAATALVAGLAWQRNEVPAEPLPPVIALTPLTSGNDAASRDLAAATGEALSHMLLAGSHSPTLKWPASAKDQADADYLLGGDVRAVGDDLVAVVQLRDRVTGTIMFSRQYQSNTEDAAGLPEHIGAEMSTNVSGALATLALNSRKPADPQVAADFLRQVSGLIGGTDQLEAYQVSKQLVARHPDAALPNLALAFNAAFSLAALPPDQRPAALREGRKAADRIVELAPEFGDSYVPWCLLRPSSLVEACENRMREGIRADPDAPHAPAFLADLMMRVGRHEEALALARASLADEPYHPNKLQRVIREALTLGYIEGGEDLYAKAHRWWPDHRAVLDSRPLGYLLAGDLDNLVRAVEELAPYDNDFNLPLLKQINDARKRGDQKRLQTVCEPTDIDWMEGMACITALSRIDDRDRAFAIADKWMPTVSTGSAAGDEQVYLAEPNVRYRIVTAYPLMAWLRSDPRYLVLAERTGLLAYWRAGHLPDFCRGPRPDPVCKQF